MLYHHHWQIKEWREKELPVDLPSFPFYIDENGEEQTTEVPTDNESRIKFQELLDNPMLKTVMGMFRSAAQTEEEEKAVEGAENFFDVLKSKEQE